MEQKSVKVDPIRVMNGAFLKGHNGLTNCLYIMRDERAPIWQF